MQATVIDEKTIIGKKIKEVYYLDDQLQKGYQVKGSLKTKLSNGQIYLVLDGNEFIHIFHHIELGGIVAVKTSSLSPKISSKNKLSINDMHWGANFDTEIRLLNIVTQTFLKEDKKVPIVKLIILGFINGEKVYIESSKTTSTTIYKDLKDDLYIYSRNIGREYGIIS